MTFVIAVAALVLLVAGFHLLAGWVYASGFRDTALIPQPPTRDFNVWVRSIARDRVILATQEPTQAVGHPGTLGLYWSNGYGQVGDVRHVEGFEVTRDFRLIEGDTPPVCHQLLTDCEPVDIESYAFPNDPGDVDLDFEEAQYTTPLGPVSTWIVPAREAKTWAIHVHGWTAHRRESIRLLPTINKAGMTSLVIDYRNDPGAPIDPTGRYRFGLSEWEDVDAAAQFAIDNGAKDILLVGYSTGAAHIMSFLERSELKNRVRATVFDAPNIILAETIRHGSRGLKLGPTPIRLTQLMTEFGMWLVDVRWKIDWDTTNYVQRSQSILTMPTLVFHGTSDQRVPISISRQLEARCPETVTLLEAQAAGHVMSWNANPAKYEESLSRFLARTAPPRPPSGNQPQRQ